MHGYWSTEAAATFNHYFLPTLMSRTGTLGPWYEVSELLPCWTLCLVGQMGLTSLR
jgi:hypothetical protein